MHGQLPCSLDEKWSIRNSPTDGWSMETLGGNKK